MYEVALFNGACIHEKTTPYTFTNAHIQITNIFTQQYFPPRTKGNKREKKKTPPITIGSSIPILDTYVNISTVTIYLTPFTCILRISSIVEVHPQATRNCHLRYQNRRLVQMTIWLVLLSKVHISSNSEQTLPEGDVKDKTKAKRKRKHKNRK